jgi:hypothetical protein
MHEMAARDEVKSASLALSITMSLPALGSNVHPGNASKNESGLRNQLKLPRIYALHVSTYSKAVTWSPRFLVCGTGTGYVLVTLPKNPIESSKWACIKVI